MSGHICYYIYEYTSRKDWSYSSTNGLINNLKKKPSLRGSPQYKYKSKAIEKCAEDLGSAINHGWLRSATLVPVPPSKSPSDPDYDDRMTKVCRAIPTDFSVDVRELVVQTASTRASHECADGERLSVQDLLDVYRINESLAAPEPKSIGVVDDVLTNGAHYVAMHTILKRRFPAATIYGMFVARRVFPPSVDPSDFDF